MNIILLGPPGAGKGTQADKIVEKTEAVHLSTGDIFRSNIKNETELGKEAKSYMDKGDLVPDETTINLVLDSLDKLCGKSILFDGFPRNMAQAEALDAYLENKGEKIDYCLNIEVPEEDLISRISGRRVCPDCGASYHVITNPPKEDGICDKCGSSLIQRDDDNEKSVKNRLDVYNSQTAVLIDYYENKGVLKTIRGEKSPEEVFDQIKEVLDLSD